MNKPAQFSARQHIQSSQAELKTFGSAVRPIYTVDKRGKPDAEGSCVLLQVRDRFFGLTAAHVLDAHESSRLYIGGMTELVELPRVWYGTPMPESGNRDDDRMDVAFFEFPIETVAEMGACIWLRPQDLITRGSHTRHPFYFAIGYPTRRAKVKAGKASINHVGDIYAGVEVNDASIYDRLNLHPATHLILAFNREKVVSSHGIRVPTVKPFGKSGGGIWRFDSLVAPSVNPRLNPLAGILTEWKKQEKVIVATRIEAYVHLLREQFPSLPL